MKTLTEVFATEHGHSGSGISYYSAFYMCARKANLMAQLKALEELEEPEDVGPTSLDIGTAYHALHEADIKSGLGQDALVDARSDTYTASQLEALRLFRGWKMKWTDLRTKYGMTNLYSEFPIGRDTEPVKGLDAPLTGRIDFAGKIDEIGIQKVFAYLGIELPGPGFYLGDFKTSASNFKTDADQHLYGLQAQAYLYLWNLTFPETPALGIIFDKITRHKVLKDESFNTYVAYPSPDAREILKAFIQGAIELREGNRANATACVERFGKPCPFLNKECKRF